MKKLLLAAVLAISFASCSKENEKPWQDSNVMLEEPDKPLITDSSKTQNRPDQAGNAALTTTKPAEKLDSANTTATTNAVPATK